jgi:hypothetical protein
MAVHGNLTCLNGWDRSVGGSLTRTSIAENMMQVGERVLTCWGLLAWWSVRTRLHASLAMHPPHRMSAHLSASTRFLGSLMMQLLEAAAANARVPTPADVAPVAGQHIRTIVQPA